MDNGEIELDRIAGEFDLRWTLESGQTYLWNRLDGSTYGADSPGSWYETVANGTYVRVRQTEEVIEWEASDDPTDLLFSLLRLDDDLPTIYERMPDDPLINQAVERYRGMRIVRDPVFPCLISFICSAQMRVERIYQMQVALAEAYGDVIEFDGTRVHTYPRADQLAGATEEELRELGLGYRAPYVKKTAEMVASGTDPTDARGLPYEEARAYLTQFVGVGDKVADCVLLFSLDFLEAVPLDTWIQRVIRETYPHCDCGNYRETSQAIRNTFGDEIAGYTQTYVFHHLRTASQRTST